MTTETLLPMDHSLGPQSFGFELTFDVCSEPL